MYVRLQALCLPQGWGTSSTCFHLGLCSSDSSDGRTEYGEYPSISFSTSLKGKMTKHAT